jgi:G3E family GTPase
MKSAIPVFLITGFLGSGKTSLLNSLLRQLAGKRVALVLNDFGQIGVDSALVPLQDGILTQELKGGQIFCSCLSGSFVETILRFEAYQPDLVLVEASGLSKPSPLLEIVTWIQDRSLHRFSYRGMICVVDAQRYLPLSKALLTLEEQVVFSDLFILNKTDLVDEATLSQVENALLTLQPQARVIHSTYGEVPVSILDIQADPLRTISLATEKYQGWGTFGRPCTSIFLPDQATTAIQIEQLLQSIAHRFYRIKGFLPTRPGWQVFASTVGPHIEIREQACPEKAPSYGLVCIHRADVSAKTILADTWQTLTGSTARIITN